MKIEIANHTYILDHRKVMYHVETETIIVADLHVGKSAHFRKAGVSMPGYSFVQDILRFQAVLEDYQPMRVMILGDLFHSDSNRECDEWEELMAYFPDISFHLIIGNHDKWSIGGCTDAMTLDSSLEENGILFTHEPTEDAVLINFCGHIHPGIRLKGSARQSLKLSCFWLSEKRLIFPAFSELTGLAVVKPKRKDRVFVPLEHKVVEI